MTRVRTPLLAVAAVVLAAAGAAGPATAQGEKDAAFKAGVEARKNKQWPKVIAEMHRAIDENPKESTRRVGRVIFGGTDYLPYYFLGEAYFKSSDCLNAVLAWETSLEQGVIRTRAEYFSELQKGNAACEAKGVLLGNKFEAAVSRARTQIDGANAALTSVKEKGSEHLGVWKSQPAFATTYDRASSEYEAARKHFGDAQRSRLEGDFNQVAKSADASREMSNSLDRDLTAAIGKFSGIVNEADAVRRNLKNALEIDGQIEAKAKYLDPTMKANRADAQKALENAREQLDPRRLSASSVDAARSLVTDSTSALNTVLAGVNAAFAKDNKLKLDRVASLASAAFSRVETGMQTVQILIERSPAKVTPAIRADFETARKQLDAARRRHDTAIRSQQVAGVEAAAKQAEAIHTRLIALEDGIGGELTLQDRGVAAWLQEGAARYFAGDYAGALDRLDDGTAAGPAQLHAYLFRAAAQHALYVRSANRDAARRDQAIADIKRCKQLQPTFTPDTRAFSPAFLEFYQRDGAPAPSASRTQ